MSSYLLIDTISIGISDKLRETTNLYSQKSNCYSSILKISDFQAYILSEIPLRETVSD